MMAIVLPEAVEFIIKRLADFGYKAHIVGGPVRDHIRGVLPDDYDITTSALPEEVKRVFADIRVIDTGIKHGTVTLLINGVGYEVTTYRIDGEYKDARRPESVEFTSDITQDLSRRDFTVNAIAYNPEEGFVDPFGGAEDISKGIIRAVGRAEKRFSEDALRILRGIRFSATLGFSVEEQTSLAIFEKKELLKKVSAERIYTEWRKLLSGRCSASVFDEYREVIGVFLPEISEAKIIDTDGFASADYNCRLLALFALCGRTGEEFAEAMKRLKTDSDTRENGRVALENYCSVGEWSRSDIGRLLYRVGAERAMLTARLAVLLGKAPLEGVALVEEYLRSGAEYRVSDLRVGGKDLLEAGLCGKQIGATLERLLLSVIDGRLVNDRQALLASAKEG